jgi:S1-C subfamily serine protease
VVVASVLADGPAAKAGLQPGDVLAAVAVVTGKRSPSFRDVDKARDLERALTPLRGGAEVRLKYTRGDDTQTANVTLGRGL